MRAVLLAITLTAATHHVAIKSMSFDPAQLTIAPGDTVMWTLETGTHTTTSDTSVWNSGTMFTPGETFPHTFQSSGSFPYHCNFHPMMTGVITVASSNKVGTSTTLESSANPSVLGQNATLTATVTKTGASELQPTGTVTFTSDGSPLCNAVTLSGGTASCSTAPLTAGTHSIVASYSGDANFEASASTPLLQTVNSAPVAPTGLAAFAPDTTQVTLTWNAVSGATGYEVHRSALNSAFTLRLTTTDPNGVDTSVSAGTTYVYKVRAMNGPAASDFSAPDAATTIVYGSDPIARAAHVNELRTGVNAMRAAAGLASATFTDDPLAIGTLIRALHVTELRNALDAARTTLGLPALAYTDPSLVAGSTLIRAAHVTQLRDGTR